MSLTRISWFTALAVFALLGFGYAHSQPTSDVAAVVYKSHNRFARFFLGSCELKVRQEQGTFLFSPFTFSPTEFKGFWALHPGTIEMAARIHQDAADGEVPSDVTETLSVTFADIAGSLEPVGYVYGNDSSQSENHYLTPHECSDLRQ